MRRRLRGSLYIQKRKTDRGKYNGPSSEWENVSPKPRRCKIQPLAGKEFIAVNVEGSEISHRIKFRYEAGLFKEKYRLLDTRTSPNRVFEIKSVINTQDLDNEIICMCIERR